MGILDDITVVDLAHHMAGPLCTQKLGDLGANVIKVEPPGGEWGRLRPINNLFVGTTNTSFLSLNRNKRGITLNLKSEAGREILYKLIAKADVCIHNYRPAAAMRLKVDYESIAAVNPRVIYCAVAGYGSTGPRADRAGQDLIVQAYSGLAWNAGRESDPPMAAGCFVADATTGYMAMMGILAALYHRQRTGEGQRIEVDLLSSCLDVQIQELTTFLNTGWSPARPRERLAHRMANPPYGIHQTADGYIALAMTPFDVLADALDCDELKRYSWDEGYHHQDEIFRIVAERLRTRSTRDWIETFDSKGVWSGPVNQYEQLASDPNVTANGMVQVVHDGNGRSVKYVGFPIRFSSTPAEIRRHPPGLGEHNQEVLGSLGFSAAEVEELRESGVL